MNKNQQRFLKWGIEMAGLSSFAFGIVNYFGISELSVTFAGMIFLFYLGLTGKLKRFKIGILEAEFERSSKQQFNIPDKVDAEVQDAEFTKEGLPYLEKVIRPLLAHKGAPVLKIVKREDNYYRPSILKEYLKYFRHVVFVDSDNKFYGYINALMLSTLIVREDNHDVLNEDSERAPICVAINKWQIDMLHPSRLKIATGLSRKQALQLMYSHDTDILPVVNEQGTFIGVIERQNIADQILRAIL